MTRFIELDKLRPNNWFLDKTKLDRIREAWKQGDQHLLPAVQVTVIDNELSLVDGHCRAYVAFENGAWGIQANIVMADQFNGNLELLRIFHQQGPAIGIRKVEDLGKKIIDQADANRRPVHISLRLGRRAKGVALEGESE